MAKKSNPTDDQLVAVQQQYEAEIEKLKTSIEDREGIGVLKKIQMDRAYNDLIEAMTLYKLKESKSYRDNGLTWEQFCETIGLERRTVDNIINDIRPIYLRFSENVSVFFGVEFNKIRLLGKSIPENVSGIKGNLIEYDGEQYPITPEGIAAVLTAIQETHKKQTDELIAKQEEALTDKDSILSDLKVSHKRLQKKTEELEMQIPKPDDDSWASEPLSQIEKSLYEFMNLLNHFVFAPDLVGKGKVAGNIKAKVEGLYQAGYRAFLEFIDKWESYTGHKVR